jgi:hypothetical protein
MIVLIKFRELDANPTVPPPTGASSPFSTVDNDLPLAIAIIKSRKPGKSVQSIPRTGTRPVPLSW